MIGKRKFWQVKSDQMSNKEKVQVGQEEMFEKGNSRGVNSR